MTITLITHKQAAALIQTVSESTLRKRDASGKFKWHPELTRWQDKPGATIWMSLQEVEAWIENRNRAFVKEPRRIAFNDIQEIAERGGKGWQRAAKFLAELTL